MGKPLAELVIPERFQSAHIEGLKRFQTTGYGPILNKEVELVAQRRNGTEFPIHLRVWPIKVGMRVHLNAFIEDITEKKRLEQMEKNAREQLEAQVEARTRELQFANERLTQELNARAKIQEELEQRELQQAIVAELGQRALSGQPMDSLMELAVTLVAKTLNARYSKILELLPEGNALVLRAGVGWRQGLVGHATVGALMDSQAGYTLLSGGPVIVTDLRTETRFSGPPLLHEHGVISGMSVVIQGRGKPYGVFGVHTDVPRSFTRDDANFLQALANVIGSAIERKDVEDKLRETAMDLSRSNRDLEHFAYLSSHDLQEPLRMVSSYVELLRRRYAGKLDAEANEFINYAVEGAKRMKLLIDDLLSFARVGKQGLNLQEMESRAILDRALNFLSLSIEETNAEINIGSMPRIHADPLHLMLVFQNLISNAIKFRGPTRPVIHIEARHEQGEWVFFIDDNGIGIAPEYRERIFVIFQRLHPREKYHGSGVGLALCRKIIESHRGRIWVESSATGGSRFLFTIPDIVKEERHPDPHEQNSHEKKSR